MKKTKGIIYIIIGIVGVILFLMHLLGFKPHDYFFEGNPGIKKYIGVNVVSMFADFSFFTYHTLIFFSIWMILQGIAFIFKYDKLDKFVRKDSIVCFVFLNYIITTVLYTLFELTSGNPTFGLYGNNLKAVWNLIQNLIIHYVFFIISLVVFIKTNSIKLENRNYFKTLFLPIIYLVSYYIVVKITGLYCYKIIWYPYPIFDGEAICSLFGILTESIFLQNLFLVIILLMIGLVYCGLYILLIKKRKK